MNPRLVENSIHLLGSSIQRTMLPQSQTSQTNEGMVTITTELTSILVCLIRIVFYRGFNYLAINYKD